MQRCVSNGFSAQCVVDCERRDVQIWSVGPDKSASGHEDYLTLIKTFAGETPLNSAAIIPGKPYVRRRSPSSFLLLRSSFPLDLSR